MASSSDDERDPDSLRKKLSIAEKTLKGRYDDFLHQIGRALIADDDLDEKDREDIERWFDYSNTYKERESLWNLIQSLEDDRRTKDPLDNGDDIDNGRNGGVLLKDQIYYYSKEHSLIKPFKEKNLKPASYSLRIGDQYSVEGESNRLVENESFEIPPFQVAVIKTKERLNMPHFLIGRWNIRVAHAYDGLLWVGGPQVDPGYSGYLFCPIYNLSDDPVKLSEGDRLARIDFVKTTEWVEDGYPQKTTDWEPDEGEEEYAKPMKYEMKKDQIVFQDYDPEELKSALFSEVKGEIEEIEGEVDRLGRVVRLSFGAIATILAVLFTTLSLLFTQGNSFSGELPLIDTGIFIGGVSLAVLAIVTILALVFAAIMRILD
ncbi:hypothetical protein OB920_05260 [Halobacteria archaeon HArc-gm2]|nr:hypothetical protein [Halobacteria archaeon HArc-gm2]